MSFPWNIFIIAKLIKDKNNPDMLFYNVINILILKAKKKKKHLSKGFFYIFLKK